MSKGVNFSFRTKLTRNYPSLMGADENTGQSPSSIPLSSFQLFCWNSLFKRDRTKHLYNLSRRKI